MPAGDRRFNPMKKNEYTNKKHTHTQRTQTCSPPSTKNTFQFECIKREHNIFALK